MNNMNEKKTQQLNITIYGIIAGGLLVLLMYANTTGWLFFNGDGKKQTWNSTGPGYHK